MRALDELNSERESSRGHRIVAGRPPLSLLLVLKGRRAGVDAHVDSAYGAEGSMIRLLLTDPASALELTV